MCPTVTPAGEPERIKVRVIEAGMNPAATELVLPQDPSPIK